MVSEAFAATPYGVGEGAAFLDTWPPDVLTWPFVGAGAGAAVVVLVPCS